MRDMEHAVKGRAVSGRAVSSRAGRAASMMVAGLLLTGSALHAQVASEPLRANSTVTGSFGPADPLRSDGTPYRIYWYSASAGERVVVTMRSSDFDSYLVLGRRVREGTTSVEDLVARETNDDGGGHRDARIEYVIPETGVYGVVANVLTGRPTGTFQLTLESSGGGGKPVNKGAASAPAPAVPQRAPLPANLRMAQLGTALTSTLTDASPRQYERRYELFWYQAEEEERVVATMRSRAFDAHLAVHGPVTTTPSATTPFEETTVNDDGGGSGDARLEYRFPRAGLYVFRARSFTRDGSGPFSFALFRPDASEPRVALAAPASAPRSGEALRARRPGEAPPAERSTPRPSAPARVSLSEAVREAVVSAEASGLTLIFSQARRMRWSNPYEIDMAPEPGEELTVVVIEQDGTHGAWISAGAAGAVRMQAAIEDRSTPGIFRTGVAVRIAPNWDRRYRFYFEIQAGPRDANSRDGHILVFSNRR